MNFTLYIREFPLENKILENINGFLKTMNSTLATHLTTFQRTCIQRTHQHSQSKAKRNSLEQGSSTDL